MSRLTDINDQSDNRIVHYDYDALSRRTVLTYGNDANAVYEYDLGNQLTKLTNNFDDTNSTVFEYSEYDKVGNRKNMLFDTNESEYTYDNRYQLTFVDYPAAWTNVYDSNYYYDNISNRTGVKANGTTTSYLHNRLNQYSTVGGTTYSYDLNGNMTNDGTWTYTYDAENRLTSIYWPTSLYYYYAYDYADRRVSWTSDFFGYMIITKKFVYDGDQIIAEYENGTLARKFVYGPDIDEPVCMINIDGETETPYYYHFDGLGSVIALTDSGSAVFESYRYDAFGFPNTTNSIGNRFMFAGREYDYETGNYYYRARYYDTWAGRFLSPDPIGYYDSMNLYQYCLNNPVNYTDPWGLSSYLFWDPAGPDFYPEAGHVDVGVDMPDGTIMVRTQAWGNPPSAIAYYKSLDAASANRKVATFSDKHSSDKKIRDYISSGKSPSVLKYCSPYAAAAMKAGGYDVGMGITPMELMNSVFNGDSFGGVDDNGHWAGGPIW